MREIEFRAWDKKEQKMILDFINYAGWQAWDKLKNAWHDSRYIKMQYTGLKDKNGEKIYEGDIVLVRFNDFWEIYTVEYCLDEDYPAFDLKPNMDCECNGLSYAVTCCEIEVIGNIHNTRKL